jgi:hypothetical protein
VGAELFDDCTTAADDNCDGVAVTCTGTPSKAASAGESGTDEVAFAAGLENNGAGVVGGVYQGATVANAVSAGSAFVRKMGLVGNQIYFKSYSAGASPSYAVVRGAQVAQSGAVYIAGEYRGTLNLGGDPTCNFGASSAGTTDIFIAQLDTSGTCVRGRHYGDFGEQTVAAFAHGYEGAVEVLYIGGVYDGNPSFGAPCGNIGAAGGSGDLYVVKFDSVFNCKWAKRAGDATDPTGPRNQTVYSAAIAPNGDVLLTGTFDGSIDFGGGALTATGVDAFTARLNPSGTQVWAKRYGGSGDQYAFGVAVDASDHIALTGAFYGQIDFGGGALTNSDAGNATSDVFVARLDGAGNHVWSKRFGDTAHQTSSGVAVDGAGNVVVTGYFKGAINFGGANLVDTDNATNDIFVAKLKASDGAHVWSARYGDAADQRVWGVAASNPVLSGGAPEQILLAGGYAGSLAFGGAAGTLTGSFPAGKIDAFQAWLAP